GDRVALLAGNSVDFIVSVFAIHFLGAISVPVNFRLAPVEISQIIEDCSPKILLTDEQYLSVASQVSQNAQIMELATLSDVAPDSPAAIEAATSGPFICALEDDQAVLYTSGTTGRPKGVVLTYSNFFTSTVRSGASWE